MYIAHPTHGAGTRPNRTQPPTAVRKTTLIAGQCVCQPRKGRGRNRQPPPQKENREGEGGGRENSPQPPNRPPTPPEAAEPPPPEVTEDRTPKEAQGDHPAKTGNTKPRTAAHREKGHRNMQTHTKKKEPAAEPERKGMGGQGPQGPRQGHPATDTTKKTKSAKNTPRQPSQEKRGTAETRALHARPHRTPEPETAGGQAERARNQTRPISRPKMKPNKEHHKQPTLEGQHHKPCPNTPNQDPSQDWRG